ncbi:hypothetical protein BJY01DRAFT_245089 [Aspergillus pseudoustus]|uniref:Fungal-type protein kinase domain-containing protein n=1 Tax=Aspergillus pseudoustus TaxID=1810923 RepID=A0ABR4KFV4_9EURO
MKSSHGAGVLQLFDHQAISSIDALHEGVVFGAPHILRSDDQEGARASYPPTQTQSGVFETVSEVLYALRDAAKAHRSLYQDAEILHQDICPGNIMITSRDEQQQRAGPGPRGVLIDLHMAKKRTDLWRQFEGIGTPPFQAIGVLQAYLPNNPHTYRHDLESFLYTFLFLAICRWPIAPGLNQLQLPPTSALNQWSQGRPVEQVRCKTHDMTAANFDRITAKFTPQFRSFVGLAKRLREILFPVRDGKPWTGTDMREEGTNALYDRVIGCFERAVAELEGANL